MAAARYNYPAIRDAVIAGRSDLMLGPWKASPWYTGTWNHWRGFSAISLSITESMTETRVTERGPDYTAGPRSRTEITVTRSVEFTAAPLPENIWRGLPEDAPEGSSFWYHASRCAFGEGLYHCVGAITVVGTLVTRERQVTDFTPASGEGGGPVVDYDDETSEEVSIVLSYSTDPANLDGLSTFCRMTAAQGMVPPSAAWFDPGLLFPPTLGPDGEPGAEVYWTDTALADLAGGGWSASMVLTGGSLSAPAGPNLGGIDNGDFDSHSFTRGGTLDLVFS